MLPSTILDDIDECWQATSWTINPHNETKIDLILQGLASPAPQSYYVLQRAATADRHLLAQFLVKNGYRFGQRGEEWVVVKESDVIDHTSLGYHFDEKTSVLSAGVPDLTRQLLDQVLITGTTHHPQHLHAIKQRLALTLGTDTRGRTAADVLLQLALAGVQDTDVYDKLATVARLELHRLRGRTQRNVKDVLHVCEKVAASGLRVAQVQSLYEEALRAPALSNLHFPHRSVLDMQQGTLDLLADRPLLWLWRHAAKQTKPVVNQDVSYERYHSDLFEDPEKPLVIDIGCGMGTSLLGLASLPDDGEFNRHLLPDGISISDCNFLGVDLSGHGIGFARGIAHRWSLTGRVQYLYAPATQTLDELLQIKAPVALAMLQFPSPYRLKPEGNSQLPMDPESGFMVSKDLLTQIHRLVTPFDGRLLLQSNAEDVALTMRDSALGLGFLSVDDDCMSHDGVDDSIETKRTTEWIRLFNPQQRATGSGWWKRQVLPPRCATETEVACRIQKTPVHRCILH